MREMKPEFYVIRLGRQVDPNKPVIGQVPLNRENNMERARRILRGFEPVEEGPPQVPEPAFEGIEGYGQEISRGELRDPVIRFTTDEAAQAYAKEQAVKNPRMLFGVLTVTSVFETGEAPVIEKKFNQAGELVLNGG